jgi:hypothetical protein
LIDQRRVSFHLATTAALKISADLQEFRVLLETKQARIFDIQVEGQLSFEVSLDRNRSSCFRC